MARRGAPAYNDNDLVVGYYRYSSSSQNEASIEQQRELVHRWANCRPDQGERHERGWPPLNLVVGRPKNDRYRSDHRSGTN